MRVSVGENFRFGHRAQGDPQLLRRRRALSDGRAPAAGDRRRDRLLQPHPRPRAGRRGGPGRRASSARPFSCAARSCTATSAGASSAFRPPTWSPTRRSCAPGHGVYACLAARTRAAAGGRQHRRAPDLRDRPRRADRGLPARLRGRPLRQRAAPGLPRAACAASGASRRVEALVEQMHRDVERDAARSPSSSGHAGGPSWPPWPRHGSRPLCYRVPADDADH